MTVLARGQVTIAVVSDGEKGDPGEAYVLHPLREEACVRRDARLEARLEYEVRHHAGDTCTVVDTQLNPALRVVCEICTVGEGGTCAATPLTRGEVSTLHYSLANYHGVPHPEEFRVLLMLHSEVVATRMVPVVFDAAASLDIDGELGQIRTVVQGPSGSGGLVQSVSTLTQRADEFDLSIRSMKPGSGNLFVNGDFSDGTAGWRQNKTTPTWGVRSDIPGSGFPRVLAVDASAYQGIYTNSSLQPLLYPMQPGREYVLSFWARANRNNVPVYFGFEALQTKDVIMGTEWERYHVTAKPTAQHTLILYPRAACTFYVAGMQIELGNQPTEWDDTAARLLATGINIRDRMITLTSDTVKIMNNSGQTTLLVDRFGKLVTSLINVNELFAQTINAQNGIIQNLILNRCVMKGLIVKDTVVINDSNRNQYIRYDADWGAGAYVLDFEKIMSGMIFFNLSASYIGYLPGIGPNVNTYTVLMKRKARSMVGNTMLLYNSGPGAVSFSGDTSPDDVYTSSSSFSIAPGKFAVLECRATVASGREVVYWKRTIGTMA